MRRRDFIQVTVGSAAAWPLAARAQQGGPPVRRIGVLSLFPEADPEAQKWDAAFREGLDELGWIDGRNIHVDYRWGARGSRATVRIGISSPEARRACRHDHSGNRGVAGRDQDNPNCVWGRV